MCRRAAVLLLILCFLSSPAAADDSELVSDVIGAKVSVPAEVLISEARAYGHMRDKVSLRGTAPDSKTISDLRRKLEELSIVKSAEIQFARRQHDKTFMFEIRVEKVGASSGPNTSITRSDAKSRIHQNALRKLTAIAGPNLNLPEGLELSSTVNIGGKSPKTSVYGTALSNQDIANFMAQLQGTEKFDKVDLSSSRQTTRGEKQVKSFRINLVLARPVGTTTVTPRQVGGSGASSGKFEYSESQKKALDDLKEEVETSGSNLAYAMFALQKHKYLHDAGVQPSDNPNDPSRWSDPYSLQRLSGQRSSMSLKAAALPNAMLATDRQTNSEIEVLTGERAVRETLQLHSIGTGPRENSQARTEPLSSIEKLKIPTHPWKKMLQDVSQVEVPEIFKLVPRDHLVVYFEDPSKISGMEDAVRALVEAGETVTSFSELLSVRETVAKRLGIAQYQKLEPLIAEMAFVSEDLSFFPNTHYAVIMRFKDEQINSAVQMFIPKSIISRSIGDYTVVSTSNNLLDRITKVSSGKAPSMRGADDFKFMLSTLDKRRDGYAYFSEDFLLNIVSPEHRINSARRNAAIDRLESLQYALLAYKSLTGRWPASWKEMVTTGFIEDSSDFNQYPFDKQGLVRSSVWGSLSDIRALSEVSISKATKAEKADYDMFKRGYQRFWTRFFDPIALTFLLDEQLYAQLVVRPLINNSEYRRMLDFVAGGDEAQRSFRAPLRMVPIQMFLKFNFDNFVLNSWREFRFQPNRDRQTEELSLEDRKQLVNQAMQEELQLNEPLDLFDMVGGELVMGLGSDIPLAFANIADVDFFMGLRLKDPARFKKFLETIYAHFAAQARNRGRGALPFLQLSSTEPMKNSYNNHEYFLIPTGFVNLYYLFHGKYVYFTVSQLAINRLIDSIGKPVQVGAYASNAMQYLGTKHDLLFIAELGPLRALREQLIGGSTMRLQMNNAARSLSGYLHDIQRTAEILGSEDAVLKLYPSIPESALGVEIRLNNNRVVLGGGKFHLLSDIRFPKRYGYQRHNRNDRRIDFFDLVTPQNKAKVSKAMENIEGFATGLSIDEDGLDARVVIDNPLITSKRKPPEPLPPVEAESSVEDRTLESAQPAAKHSAKKNARKGHGADIAIDRFRTIDALRSQSIRSIIINIVLGSLLVVIIMLVIHRRAQSAVPSSAEQPK